MRTTQAAKAEASSKSPAAPAASWEEEEAAAAAAAAAEAPARADAFYKFSKVSGQVHLLQKATTERTFENECPDFEREQEAREYISLAAGTARAATDVTDYCSRAV
jgi:hypothetical protein